MKKIILSFLLLATVFSALATPETAKQPETQKFAKGKGAILLDDLKEGTVYGSLEKISGKNKAKSTRLIGQLAFDAPKDKLLSGNKFVLIGWLGVQKIQDPSKIVMFKEPIVSSFVIQSDRDAKGVVLPTFGEKAYLTDALERLEAGDVDEQEIKKKRKIKIPTGTQELLLPEKLNPSNPKTTATANLSSENNTAFENSDLKASTTQNESDPLTSVEKSKRNDYLLANRTGMGSQDHGMSSSNFPLMHSSDPMPNTERSRSEVPVHPAQQISHDLAQPFSLHILPELDEEHLPNIQGNAVILTKKPNGTHQAYIVRDGHFSRGDNGKLLSKEVTVNVAGLIVSDKGKVERNPGNEKIVDRIIDDVFFNFRTSESAEGRASAEPAPDITIESTEEGCVPEHNEAQETVTILRRLKTFEDGLLVQQGECEKTLEIYGVKRDYLCEHCQDEVKREENKVYPQYQEYWIDRDQQRRNLRLKVDLTNPLELIEDTKGCGFDTTLEAGFALQKSRLGYVNKFGRFIILEECRVIEGARRSSIHETSKGCPLIHDFENKVTHEQKRTFFKFEGVEHEVETCHRQEPALDHEFVKTGCKPIIDVETGTITHTAKRRIQTSAGLKFITQECEPMDTVNLLFTRERCEGQYVHDLVAGKSYLKKRYYVMKEHDLQHFLTGCIRTNDFLSHQTEHHGEWVHDDTQLISKPKLSLYINCAERGKTKIDEPKVRGILGQRSYEFVENKTKPTSSFYFEGCFRRTRTDIFMVYKRPDNSVYEKLMGPGNPIVSTTDECTRRTEKQYLRQTSTVVAIVYGIPDIRYYNIYQQRIITSYPDGQIINGQWQELSEPTHAPYQPNNLGGYDNHNSDNHK